MSNDSATQDSWVPLILGESDPTKVWTEVFARLRDLALNCEKGTGLDRTTIIPDRLLAESAWSLWEQFPQHAPSAIDEIKRFWVSPGPSGTAVLILDALSLRELHLLVSGAAQRGLSPSRIEVRGAEIPTETDQFAAAIGLPQRSSLSNNRSPATFTFGGPDVYADFLSQPFADCVGFVGSTPRLFLWHEWPDKPLIHGNADKDDGPDTVARETKKQLLSDGFWQFVDRLRQGRRLVITGDHGYAVSRSFSSEVKDPDSVRLLRETFGAKRCARESAERPWPRAHLPPLVCRHNGWLVVLGQRKWAVQGGFPTLCHRGLSLLEAAVPFIEFPPK